MKRVLALEQIELVICVLYLVQKSEHKNISQRYYQYPVETHEAVTSRTNMTHRVCVLCHGYNDTAGETCAVCVEDAAELESVLEHYVVVDPSSGVFLSVAERLLSILPEEADWSD